MTIDDAIRHCSEIADRNDAEAKRLRLLGEAPDELGRTVSSCKKCANNHRQLAEWLTELKELREKQKWIPCSERPPEEGERVLCTHLGRLNPNRQVIEHIYHNGEFIFGWYMDMNPSSPTFGKRYMGEVVAWMPFPEPYKPKDGFTKWAKSVADEHRKKGEIE